MTALLLFLALVAVVLFWALSERYFKRRFHTMLAPIHPGDVAAQISWEQKMAIVRRHEAVNWCVALVLIAIVTGFIFTGHGYYVEVMGDTSPPQVTPAAGGVVPGPVAGSVLYWTARLPGGRMWPAVEDGGFVLVRAIRGASDQYLLFASTGALIWEGDKVAYGPAPRAAVASWAAIDGTGGTHQSGRSVAIAVETAAGAHLIVLSEDGKLLRDERLVAYPDDDQSFFSIKTAEGALRSRMASPDGRWLASTKLLPSISFIMSHLNLFGPASGTR